jgi:hypothetical protein
MPRIALLALLIGLPFSQAAASLTEALALGRTHDQALYDAFNAGYKLAASGDVASVEVITEFRRAVLLVREHANQGEYSFTEHDLAGALAPFRGTVAFVAILRLNPLNTYTQPPSCDLYIRTGPASKPLPPTNLRRDPVYPPGIGIPGGAMTGVRLEGTFSGAEINGAKDPFLVIVDPNGRVVWEGRVDLSRFR